MAEDRPMRERNKVTYAEYDDDDFESPVKKAPKKMVIDSEEEEAEQKPVKGGLLAFAKEGINNARQDLEAGAKAQHPKRAAKANDLDDTDEDMVDDEDPIEDSDLNEENERPWSKNQNQQERPHRAAPKGSLGAAASSDDEDLEEESGEGSSEEEEEDLAESSSEEEDEEMAEQDDSDVDAKKKKNTGKTSGSRSLRPRAAPAPPAGARRSARATTAAAKTYNEDEIMQQYYSSEEEQEEEEEKPGSRHGAKLAKKSSFDSNEENREPSTRRSTRPQRAAAAIKKKPSGYGTSDEDDFSGDSSDNEAERNSDDDGAIYISSGSDGEGGYAAAGGDEGEDRKGPAYDDDECDEETLVNNVERILALRKTSSGDVELYVKITGWSFRRARWLPRSVLVAAGRAQLVRNFEKKAVNGSIDPYGDLVDGVHPSWLEVDRILTDKESSRLGQWYLVKWRGLGHSEATWERASDLTDSEADKEAVVRYHKLAEAAAARLAAPNQQPESKELNPKAVPEFLNGRSLRPYQLESLEWMAKHWCAGSNCILGDEMGLGKTAQSISVLVYQRQFGGVHGPFLVIAPLTTLGHWQREIETWTDMDCVVYAGSAADRAACHKYDLFVPGSSGGRGRRGRLVKPNVVLSSYETILRDATLFASIEWETVIIDEAHRMKTVGSSTRTAIADLDIGWLLLLTGTPVQNNMRELFGLLNLLDADEYSSEADFLDRFGDERTGMSPNQVRELQKALKPILLRRMKEDVENLPEKEECIIWTQLTIEQRAYYKAIFEKQIGTLLAGASQKNVPKLRNLAMELRKVCCHPFLCDGLEDDVAARRRVADLETDEISNLVQASGKMLLLHKLLPKLRSEGHKVLIFSQFKIMLDVLEDYMKAAQFPCERIDGSTSSRDRQAAIDRYSKEGSDGFVFLLSTRAGGQGITLTAADTCIIYDSDWNPQNDLQAMARCHRIGQEKDVTIYRLVSKDTYEEHVFKTSSRKYGLDEAILGGIGGGPSGANGGNDDKLDGKKIADLLKHGAHCLDKVEEANAETEAFASEDIDQILKGRTEKRQIGGRAGNTFSVATFEVGGGAGGSGAGAGANASGAADDKSFWTALLPEAAAAHETEKIAAKHGHILLAPRQRKKVSYNDGSQRRKRRNSSGNDNDSDFLATEDGNDSESGGKRGGGRGPAAKKQNAGGGGAGGGGAAAGPKPWSIRDANNFFDQLMRFGFSETVGIPKAIAAAGLESKGYLPEDFPAVAAVLHAMLVGAPNAVASKPPARLPTLQQEVNRQLELMRHQLVKAMEAADPEGKALAYANLMSFSGPANTEKATALATAEIERIKQANAQWESGMSSAAANLATSCAASLIPAHCMRALQDVKLAERMIKFQDQFSAHLKEVDLIAQWAATGNQAPPLPHKAGFPHWWTRTEDTKLLKGMFSLGWAPLRKQAESVDLVLQHPEFGFREKMVVSNNQQQGVGGGATRESGAPLTTTAAGAAEMVREDSFQVRHSPGQLNDGGDASKPAAEAAVPADGATTATATATTVAAPLLDMVKLGGLPRVYTPSEWTKMRDTLTKHVKHMCKYLDRAQQQNLKIAEYQQQRQQHIAAAAAAATATAAANDASGAGPSGFISSPSSVVSEEPMQSLLPTEVLDSQGSGSLVSDDAAAVDGPSAAAPKPTGAGASSIDLLKKVLQREAIKQLGSGNVNAGKEKMEEVEDPIEPFSDDDDEKEKDDEKSVREPEKKKLKKSPSPAALATAAKPKPLTGPVATPGSGTVSALNVFKETRGNFTDGASGSGAKPRNSPGNGKKKAKSKLGNGGMGSQLSLLQMPSVVKYYSKGGEPANGGAAANQGGGEADAAAEQKQRQQQESEVIDLVSSD